MADKTGSISIRDGVPVRWVRPSSQGVAAQVEECFALNRTCGSDTVVAIHNLPNQAHWFAKRLNGCFQSIEEVESRDLMKHCGLLEDSSGLARASRVVVAACNCMVRIPPPLQAIRAALKRGGLPQRGKAASACPALLTALESAATDGDFARVAECLDIIARMPGVVLFRRELLGDISRTCRLHDMASGSTLRRTAWKVRDSARRYGRHLPQRVVARTLLIKGLEFDHAVVLDADGVADAKNLYVALTRASKSLTVVSKSPSLACVLR